ncbi:hypothetical protein BGX28_007579 [Mortierella sp. GBA30]|nr:hypothetical protein BGX28_007579 [Mortierella sp. GBA30]
MAPLVNAKEWFKKRQGKKNTSANNSNNSSDVSDTYACTADAVPTTAPIMQSQSVLQTPLPPLATPIFTPINHSDSTIAPRWAPETTYVPRTQYISSKELKKSEEPSATVSSAVASASLPYLPYQLPPFQATSPLTAEPRNTSHTSLPTRFRLSGDFKKDLKSSHHSHQQHTSFQPTKQKQLYHSLQNQLPPTQPRPVKEILKQPQQQQQAQSEKKEGDLKTKDGGEKALESMAFLHHDLTTKAFAEYQAAKIFKGLSAKFRTSSETLRDSESVAQEYARTIKALWQMVEDEELSQRMVDASPEERERMILHHNTSRELPFHGLDLTATTQAGRGSSPNETRVDHHHVAKQQQQEVPATAMATTRHGAHRGSQESIRSETSLRRRSAQSGGSYRHKDSHYIPYNSQHHHHHNAFHKTHDPRLSAIRESSYHQDEEETHHHLYRCPPAPRSSLQEARVPLHHRIRLQSIQHDVYQRIPEVGELSDGAEEEEEEEAAVSSTLVSETVQQSALELQKRDHYTISERLAMEEDWRMQARLLKTVLEDERRDALRVAQQEREQREQLQRQELQHLQDLQEQLHEQLQRELLGNGDHDRTHVHPSHLQEQQVPQHHYSSEQQLANGHEEAGEEEDEAIRSRRLYFYLEDDRGEQFSELESASAFHEEDEEEFCKRFRLGEDEDDDDIELETERLEQELDILGLPQFDSYRCNFGVHDRFDVRDANRKMMLADPRIIGFHDVDMVSVRK